MALPIIMHVNYCEQGQSIDEICFKAVEWGYDGIEFRRKRHDVDEEPEAYLDEIRRAADKSGLKEILFGSPGLNLTMADEKKRQEEIESAVKFYKLAAERFKLTVCNTVSGLLFNPDENIPHSEYNRHGSFTASEEQWMWCAEGFKVLGKLACELKFKFAFETHMWYLNDLPETAVKLADLIGSPNVGVNLDYGNTIEFRNIQIPSLEKAISVIGSKLYYVHLKNSCRLADGSQLPTSLADGEINHREYLKLLKKYGFNGPICIEAPRSGDCEWFARQDIFYLKSVLEDIGW